MPRFEDTIEVDVPVRTAYDQWTQFESFPQFMEGVESVVQRDDRTIRWTAVIAGQRKTWTAQITDQNARRPRRMEEHRWLPRTLARFSSRRLAMGRTRITLKLDADPEGVGQTVGANLGFLDRG